MSNDEIAERQMRAAMQGRMGSAFNPDTGQLDAGQTARMGGQVGLGEYLDLGSIQFPGTVKTSVGGIPCEVPLDGDHATRFSWLVVYMATLPEGGQWGGVVGGPLSVHDQKVLHAAAVLYSGGGVRDGAPKNGTGVNIDVARSAAKAEEYLKRGIGAGTYWGRADVREEVCRVIVQHADPAHVASDRRLQIFVDGLRFELTRIMPNTSEGLRVLKAFCNKDEQQRWHFGWSRSRDNLVAWMREIRGWK